MIKKRDVATVLLGITIAIILWITILSRETLIGSQVIYRPFHAFISFYKDIQKGRLGANFLGNIMMFFPVGVLIPLVIEKVKWRWVVLAGFGFSLIIETVQLITGIGYFDLEDVLLNTIGTSMGFWLCKVAVQRRKYDSDGN